MRVISGIFKGKKLFSPSDDSVRPTTDRIKETVFNILGSKNAVEDARVLDLFCGSGALGIEALSRGARLAVFIDKCAESVRLTQKNLEHIGAAAEVYHADFRFALKKLNGRQFDLIFIDPPYSEKIGGILFESIKKFDILAKEGTIVVEHSRQNELQKIPDRYIIDERFFGKTAMTFLTKADLVSTVVDK